MADRSAPFGLSVALSTPVDEGGGIERGLLAEHARLPRRRLLQRE